MFVCLGFGHFILFVYFFPWPRSSKGRELRKSLALKRRRIISEQLTSNPLKGV